MQWEQAAANPDEFMKNMNKTMKSLVKNIDLYSFDDITSLSFNPNNAKPMSSAIRKNKKYNSTDTQEAAEEDNIKENIPVNIGRYPPSLLCKLCKNLM